MDVKLTVKEISPIKQQLDVVVSEADVQEELDEAYRKIGQKAKIKGFRPGKIPRSVLEQNYREDAESDAIRNLLSKSYAAVIEETDIHPIGAPEVKLTGFGTGQSLTYEAIVEVRPVFEAKGYQGMELTREKVDVNEQEIEENLKGLQERMAQLIPLTEPRPVRANDVLTIDYKGFSEAKPVPGLEAKDFLVEVGRGYLFPELDEGIPGMASGEKKKILVTYPLNWTDNNLAGKKVEFEITLKEIKEKKLPELSDDFAKDLGSHSTLADLKEKIRADITRGKEQRVRNRLRRVVIEKLIQANDFPIPEGMIQAELEHMLQMFEGNLKSQGMSLQQAGVTREEFFAKNRDEAVFRTKGAMIFDAISQKENISVTSEEVDRRIEEMARLAGQSPEVWKNYYRQKNRMENIEAAIREEKTLDFVLTQSKIKIEG